MAVPTTKAPEINAFLNLLMGKDRVETIKANKCIFGDGDAKEFKNPSSEHEYKISGICQTCQNEYFA